MMSTHIASARGVAVGICGAMLLGMSSIAQADCNWPEAKAIEERHREPTVVGGVPFVAEFYSYHLPSYQISSLQCNKRIEWGPRGWELSLGSDVTPLHERSGALESHRGATLPPLPPLPPVPQTTTALAPLPKLESLPQLPSVPALEPLSDLPPLPPVPPL